MHVFITGIAGFMGSHLADYFLADGHQVSGNDHLRGGERAHVPAGSTFHEVDCCDLEAMKRCLRGVDVVIHCASMAHEGFSVFGPVAVTRDNVMASVTVFTAAIDCGVRRIVYCSSMARYGEGPSPAVPFTEGLPTAPVDPYGIAKVTCESMLRNLAETHGVEWSIVVPHNVFGPRQKYDDPYRNVVAIMANLMLQGRQPFIYGDGEQQRAFSPIGLVTESIARVALHEKAELLLNIGPSDSGLTINALAQKVAGAVGFAPLAPVYVGQRPLEVKRATCDCRKAAAVLDLQHRDPDTDFHHTLDALVAYIRTQGPKAFDYHATLEIDSGQTPATWQRRLM